MIEEVLGSQSDTVYESTLQVQDCISCENPALEASVCVIVHHLSWNVSSFPIKGKKLKYVIICTMI